MNKNQKGLIGFTLFVVLIISFRVHQSKTRYNRLINNSGYAVGITQKKVNGAEGSVYVEFTFYTDDSLVVSSTGLENNVKIPDGLYLVVYSKSNYETNKIFFDIPINKNCKTQNCIDSLAIANDIKSKISLWE